MSVINGLYTNDSQANAIRYDNTNSQLEANNTQGAIDELCSLNRMYTHNITLLASNWHGTNAPFTYTILLDDIETTSNVYIGLDAVSEETYNDIANYCIDVDNMGDGYVRLVAQGNKPIYDIPIVVFVGRLIATPDGRNAKYILYTNETEHTWLASQNVNGAINDLITYLSNFKPDGHAGGIRVDDATLNLGVTNVQQALEKLCESGTKRNHIGIHTLEAGGWIGASAPYLYNLYIDGVTENSDFDINASFDMTSEQYQELSKAYIVAAKTTADGRIVIKAFGEKPSVDLPVDIIQYN